MIIFVYWLQVNKLPLITHSLSLSALEPSTCVHVLVHGSTITDCIEVPTTRPPMDAETEAKSSLQNGTITTLKTLDDSTQPPSDDRQRQINSNGCPNKPLTNGGSSDAAHCSGAPSNHEANGRGSETEISIVVPTIVSGMCVCACKGEKCVCM